MFRNVMNKRFVFLSNGVLVNVIFFNIINRLVHIISPAIAESYRNGRRSNNRRLADDRRRQYAVRRDAKRRASARYIRDNSLATGQAICLRDYKRWCHLYSDKETGRLAESAPVFGQFARHP